MRKAAFDYGREAFAVIEQMERLSSTRDILDAMERFLAPFGFQKFVLHGIRSPEQRFEDAVAGRNWPVEWCKIYARERYDQDDPVAYLLKRASKPFAWSNKLYAAARAPRATEIMRRRSEFGIKRGF